MGLMRIAFCCGVFAVGASAQNIVPNITGVRLDQLNQSVKSRLWVLTCDSSGTPTSIVAYTEGTDGSLMATGQMPPVGSPESDTSPLIAVVGNLRMPQLNQGTLANHTSVHSRLWVVTCNSGDDDNPVTVARYQADVHGNTAAVAQIPPATTGVDQYAAVAAIVMGGGGPLGYPVWWWIGFFTLGAVGGLGVGRRWK